eukprot:m51a1_g12003 putative dna ligase 3 (895) ;mRNA; f:142-3815
MVSDLEKGNVMDTASKFFAEYGRPAQSSTLTLREVDDWLQRLSGVSKEEEQVGLFRELCGRATARDLRSVVGTIRHDLGIAIGPKFVLDALHPAAFEAYKNSNDLRRVVDKVCSHRAAAAPDASAAPAPGKLHKTISTGISLRSPIKPMLCKPVKSIEEVMRRMPGGFFSEIKYDGERIQIHKDGEAVVCYSRKLKPIMEWKVAAVRDYIPQALRAHSAILDGEVLLMDVERHRPLPFGTLGVHKKNNFSDATVCIFLFDILYLEGESLMDQPITRRRELLESSVAVIPNRVELSEMQVVREEDDLCAMLTRVIREQLEGLVVKSLDSVYEPDARHWLKIKKDYLESLNMADSADLLVLGGYYGTGRLGGKVSVFLMGVYDQQDDVFRTVCKVGNGFDEATVDRLQEELVKPLMVKIEKRPESIPAKMLINRALAPDWLTTDPWKSPVWEITGAQFSSSSRHTAAGLSIRMRDDKEATDATTLAQLRELAKTAAPADFRVAGGGKRPRSDSGSGSGSDAEPPQKRPAVSPAAGAPSAVSAAPRALARPPSKARKATEVSRYFGNAFEKDVEGAKLVLVLVDDANQWRRGDVGRELATRWPHFGGLYDKDVHSLGDCPFVKVASGPAGKTFVCCAVARKYVSRTGDANYQAKSFELALNALSAFARHKEGTVVIQQSCCGIPDSSWGSAEAMIAKCLVSKGVPTLLFMDEPAPAAAPGAQDAPMAPADAAQDPGAAAADSGEETDVDQNLLRRYAEPDGHDAAARVGAAPANDFGADTEPEEAAGPRREARGARAGVVAPADIAHDGVLPNLFTGLRISLHRLPRETEDLMRRYIIAYDGEVASSAEAGDATHVVTNDCDEGLAASEKRRVVKAQWLWDCINTLSVRDCGLYSAS